MIYRIIDANINRLKEGLRVIEEWCRFGLDDKSYAQICKNARHEIVEILQQAQIPFSKLVSSRNTEGDVGVSISSPNEYERADIKSVLKANFNRVQEALRVLEEYSKIFKSGKPFEKIRYEMYTLEKNLFTSNQKINLSSNVYILLTTNLCHLPLMDCLKELLEAGARLFQLREKQISDQDFYELARQALALIKQYDGTLIINDNFSIAQTVGCDGVHLGLNDLPLERVADLVTPDFIIGATVHDLNELKEVPGRVDYIGIGPCFKSQTKPDLISHGLDNIKNIYDESVFTTFAIGGIGLENSSALLEKNIDQWAVCSEIIGSSTPGLIYKNFLEKIKEHKAKVLVNS